MLDLPTATTSHIMCLMFNPDLSKQNRKQDLETHNKSGNEDSGDMSEEEEEEEVRTTEHLHFDLDSRKK